MMCYMKDGKHVGICAVAVGLALGVTSALYTLVFGWVAWLGGYGVDMVHQMSTVYLGYAPSFMGGLIGGGWALVDGFIFGVILGWLYNFFYCCCMKKCGGDEGRK